MSIVSVISRGAVKAHTHCFKLCLLLKKWIKFYLQWLCFVTCVCWTCCSALHPDSYDPHARPSLDMSGFDVPVEREVQVESHDVGRWRWLACSVRVAEVDYQVLASSALVPRSSF